MNIRIAKRAQGYAIQQRICFVWHNIGKEFYESYFDAREAASVMLDSSITNNTFN
jgi:hypothetical protein